MFMETIQTEGYVLVISLLRHMSVLGLIGIPAGVIISL